MGKTYVVFVGRKPGVYETWEEAHSQVNKFSGAYHKSYWNRDEASNAFHAYLEKQNSSASFMSDEESSCATFNTAPNRSTDAEKLLKVKDLLLYLENENRNHLKKVAGLVEEIKQLVQSLEISGEN
ncbi:uncharacterized protein LOC142551010 [Primulina tabacum]|uniref:uncharacterized protein LOC142551010 n=1 Tax=Primulina tabacum TaxID=48773 RepID=UPI003F5A4C0A